MPPEPEKVAALRRLLNERFPRSAVRRARVVPTGVPKIDALLEGGLLTGTLTEFVSALPSAGNQLSLGSILLSTRLARQRVALVDAANAFDWTGDDDAVAHLVWIRCPSLPECWRAADLAARDPNYAVTVIDVRGFPARSLLRTKDGIWTRLQRAAEHADTAVLVQSPTPIVPNAARRLIFNEAFPPGSLTNPRAEILENLAAALHRSRAVPRERAG